MGRNLIIHAIKSPNMLAYVVISSHLSLQKGICASFFFFFLFQTAAVFFGVCEGVGFSFPKIKLQVRRLKKTFKQRAKA